MVGGRKTAGENSATEGENKNIKVIESSFHRNGVGGLGFYAVLFTWKPEDEEKPEKFLATVFDEPGAVAVISLDRIAKDGVEFGENSWRGDRFEGELRQQIKNGTGRKGIRIGPFAIPTKKAKRI